MDNKKFPKITVITVSYNTVQTIEHTILSVINQTYSNIEYIIIDGGSTDGTIDIIKKYKDQIAYWVSEPDKGIYDAMNKGIKKATGQYIQFLNASDTIYTRETIKQIVNKIPHNYPDVIYGNIIIEKSTEYWYMKPGSLEDFENKFPIYHPSTWVKNSLMKKYAFDTTFKIAADFNILRKLYYSNAIFYYIPLFFTVFEGINGISSTNEELREKEKRRILNSGRRISSRFLDYIVKITQLKYRIMNRLLKNKKNNIKNDIQQDPRIIKIIYK